MDVYDMRQRYARATPKKREKPSDEPSAKEQEANWTEWQNLHPYEEVSSYEEEQIRMQGKAGWPAP